MVARWLLAVLAVVAGGRAATQEVYVWQRQFGADVAAAWREFAPQVDAVCVLAAEIAWSGGRMQVLRLRPDYAALAVGKKPLGLALRIGAFAGPFAENDATARGLGDVVVEMLAQARAAGVGVAEVQIDFDAAEAKLAGYVSWLKAVRARTNGVRLVFTALPAWLRHAAFRELARAADGFVLQVHSLERPASIDARFSLCEPERALAWVRQAAEIGKPFRVALPTYGYLLGFDPAGKFIGLSAEGPRRSWPPGTRLRAVRSDPLALTPLARALRAEPPPNCAGVIWFRLPVAGDRLNWDPATFAAVLHGELPERRLTVEAVWSESGLAEIVVTNRGLTTEPMPSVVHVKWPAEARVLAADGIGGFGLEIRGAQAQGILRAAEVPADASLAPGRTAKIAWLRFAHEVSLEVSSSAPP